MARHLFGLSPSDVTVEQVGEDMKLRPESVGTAWTALTGGTQITDLLDMNSDPQTVVVSDENSVVGFYGPDGVTSLYMDFGFSSRVLMQAMDLGDAIGDLETGKLDVTGGTLTGALTIAAVEDAPELADLPLGSTAKAASTGINLISSFAGGEDVTAGEDSTARINVYSYQRASTHSFGEIQRMYAMRQDSKQMLAWYGWVNPDRSPGYDPVTREPAVGASCKPIAWIGAHIEANDHASMHNHISIEVPDTTGALQTRFEIQLGDRTTGLIGLDKTFIITNDSDFAVRQSGGESFRVVAPAGTEKRIEFMGDAHGDSTTRRWKLRSTSTAESGSNAGSDFEIVRYDDTGTAQSATFIVKRSNGLVGFGTAVGDIDSRITVRQDGTASAGKFVSTSEGTASTATLRVETSTTSKRALDYRLSGDTVSRIRFDASTSGGNGTITFGDGTTADTALFRYAANGLGTNATFRIGTAATLLFGASGDVNLYRAAADRLQTDDKFVAGGGLGAGNSAAATTLGTVTRKMEVFDASGASLGFVPIYDAIS